MLVATRALVQEVTGSNKAFITSYSAAWDSLSPAVDTSELESKARAATRILGHLTLASCS